MRSDLLFKIFLYCWSFCYLVTS